MSNMWCLSIQAYRVERNRMLGKAKEYRGNTDWGGGGGGRGVRLGKKEGGQLKEIVGFGWGTIGHTSSNGG